MKTLQCICFLFVFFGTLSAQVNTMEKRLDPTTILGKWIRIDPSDNPGSAHHINWMHFLPNNKVEWSLNRSPTSQSVIRRGSYTLMLSGNLAHHASKSVLLRIDPTPYSPAIGGEREDGTPIFLMDLQVGKRIDNRIALPDEAEILKFRTDVSDFFFTKDKNEAAPSDGDKPSK